MNQIALFADAAVVDEYTRTVAAGRMSQEESDRQIEAMEAVQATLERLLADSKAKTAPELF